jgi:undecaprenyl pyrophosphate phosphatase UppP
MSSKVWDYLGITENGRRVRPTRGQMIGLVVVTIIAALASVLTKHVSHSSLISLAVLVGVFVVYSVLLSAWGERQTRRSSTNHPDAR